MRFAEMVRQALSIVLRYLAWVFLINGVITRNAYVMAAAAFFIVVETYEARADMRDMRDIVEKRNEAK